MYDSSSVAAETRHFEDLSDLRVSDLRTVKLTRSKRLLQQDVADVVRNSEGRVRSVQGSVRYELSACNASEFFAVSRDLAIWRIYRQLQRPGGSQEISGIALSMLILEGFCSVSIVIQL
jgi:hypothetical protein